MAPIYGNSLVIFTTLLFSGLFFSKKLRKSITWRATVTPLASIIGSGFLVSAPLLILTTGQWAFAVMTLIVVIAYCLGSVMRFNIVYLEPLLTTKTSSSLVLKLETISRPILGLAYIISVAFYLKLLSAFLLRGLSVVSHLLENSITTGILIMIGVIGWRRGLSLLESFEKYSVNIKLIIIFSMIVGHLVFNANLLLQDQWHLEIHDHYSPSETLQKLLGILIIVQGFETSRYLGELYSSEVRIKTMRYAQIISGIVYILFVSSAMLLFNDIHSITEVAAIDLCRMIAPILPWLLIIAAMMSQFSAAIADTLGSSGLISEATQHKVSLKSGILLVSIIAIGLTWTTNIYQIITIASKAFAIYYAIQCLIAIRLTFVLRKSLQKYTYLTLFGLLFILMVLVVLLGIPVE